MFHISYSYAKSLNINSNAYYRKGQTETENKELEELSVNVLVYPNNATTIKENVHYF